MNIINKSLKIKRKQRSKKPRNSSNKEVRAMFANDLNQPLKQFLEITSNENPELPPHIRGLFVRPATPAGVPYQHIDGEPLPKGCTICLPSYPNESEGG
jgi:hypothetical protein